MKRCNHKRNGANGERANGAITVQLAAPPWSHALCSRLNRAECALQSALQFALLLNTQIAIDIYERSDTWSNRLDFNMDDEVVDRKSEIEESCKPHALRYLLALSQCLHTLSFDISACSAPAFAEDQRLTRVPRNVYEQICISKRATLSYL